MDLQRPRTLPTAADGAGGTAAQSSTRIRTPHGADQRRVCPVSTIRGLSPPPLLRERSDRRCGRSRRTSTKRAGPASSLTPLRRGEASVRKIDPCSRSSSEASVAESEVRPLAALRMQASSASALGGVTASLTNCYRRARRLPGRARRCSHLRLRTRPRIRRGKPRRPAPARVHDGPACPDRGVSEVLPGAGLAGRCVRRSAASRITTAAWCGGGPEVASTGASR